MSSVEISRLDHGLDLNEFHYCVYLVNQGGGDEITVGSPKGSGQFGHTIAMDLKLKSSNGDIVGYAKGLRVHASYGGTYWHSSFDIVFTNWLQGSSLQVVGDFCNDWSIVGGTGEFTMARGVIYREKDNKLDIHAFYIPMKKKAEASPGDKNVWKYG